MTGPLDIYEEPFRPERDRGAVKPRSVGEIFTAARDLQEVDNSDYLDRLYDEEFRKVLEAVNEVRAQENLPVILPPSMGYLPRSDRDRLAQAGNAYAAAAALERGNRRQVAQMILQEAARIRGTRPDFLAGVGTDVDAYLLPRIEQEQARRQKAGEVMAGADGLALDAVSLAGGMTMALEDPANLAMLPFGGVGKTVAHRILAEGLLNAGIELVLQPQAAENREALGEELTSAEAAQNVLFAFVGGAAFQGLGEAAFAGAKSLKSRLTPLERKLAQALEEADPLEDPFALATELLAREDPELAATIIRAGRGELTPDETGALATLQRESDIDAANPFEPIGTGRAQFEDDLTRAIDAALRASPVEQAAAAAASAVVDAGPLPVGRTAPTPNIQAPDLTQYLARNRSAESGGNDAAAAETSSAFGRYQFLQETWLSEYRKTFGDTGESRAQILRKRADGEIQDKVMITFTQGNMDRLQTAGMDLTEGNLYLAHFLGIGDALKVLRTAPDQPIRGLISQAAINANPAVFKNIGSASELIAWAHRKMGGGAASVPIGGGRVGSAGDVDQGAVLRAEALELQRQAADIDGLGPVEFERFDPDELEVDAQLMQFKAGGDEFGVTERLRGVTQWNPFFAGRVMVWEAADGRRLIADGHQRLGLARRIKGQDDGQRPMLDAFILRESDGWDAELVRTYAALKNIAEGTGSPVDAAKVLRGLTRQEWGRFLPPKSALVRDAEGLVRLGDDAFGMVVNEIVDPSYAAIVGRLARDPGEQKALVDLLAKLAPRTRGEAEGVVRQGLAAGFNRETQEDMFGSLDMTNSLYIERARVLDKGLAELRKMRQAFGSAARNAEALEAGGNRIDRAASAREVEDNAKAVELVSRSAWSKGPVKELIDRGAQRLANGERISDIVRDFVAQVRELDLADLARIAGRQDGGDPDGLGRAGEAGQEDATLFSIDGDPPEPQLTREGDRLDPQDNAWPSRDELEELGQEPFDLEGAGPLEQFDQAGGSGSKIQTDSLEHDARQLQRTAELDRQAETVFTIDGEERKLGDVLEDAEQTRSAIATARACL